MTGHVITIPDVTTRVTMTKVVTTLATTTKGVTTHVTMTKVVTTLATTAVLVAKSQGRGATRVLRAAVVSTNHRSPQSRTATPALPAFSSPTRGKQNVIRVRLANTLPAPQKRRASLAPKVSISPVEVSPNALVARLATTKAPLAAPSRVLFAGEATTSQERAAAIAPGAKLGNSSPATQKPRAQPAQWVATNRRRRKAFAQRALRENTKAALEAAHHVSPAALVTSQQPQPRANVPLVGKANTNLRRGRQPVSVVRPVSTSRTRPAPNAPSAARDSTRMRRRQLSAAIALLGGTKTVQAVQCARLAQLASTRAQHRRLPALRVRAASFKQALARRPVVPARRVITKRGLAKAAASSAVRVNTNPIREAHHLASSVTPDISRA